MTDKNKIQKDLCKILDDKRVLSDAEDMGVWACDWTQEFDVDPFLVVFPKSTAEVCEILSYCHNNKVSVVPSGGRTGLAAGAVATNQELVLSLDKMTKVLDLDPIGMTVEVEAGVLTENVQKKAQEAGLYFPIDLASKGSSQIGGNIATNAGGLKFIRYGGMRESVLGLEIVLANGEVLDLNTPLYKNNTGYDLKQLFIGSEGTLGVITKAQLKLARKPHGFLVSYLGFETSEKLLNFLEFVNQQNIDLSAFEFFTDEALQKVKQVFPDLKTHYLTASYPFYAIVEIETKNDQEKTKLEALWMKAFEKKLICDAFLASNSEEFKGVWDLRENITESLAVSSHVRKNDITISISKINKFLEQVGKKVKEELNQLEIIYFGHLGDGNLHVNYIAPKGLAKEKFMEEAKRLEEIVLSLVIDFKGSVSAEHGIGLLKKKALAQSMNQNELGLMKSLKKVFDPLGIMNPGKIFD